MMKIFTQLMTVATLALCPLMALDAPELPICGKPASGRPDSAHLIPLARTHLSTYANENEEVLNKFDALIGAVDGEGAFSADAAGGRQLLDAIAFAAYCHRDQQRKGKPVPYIIHPMDVALILWEQAGVRDMDVLSAAVLHDVVEDTDASIEDVRLRYGQTVATYVQEVSHPKELAYEARHRWQIATAAHMSEGGRLVKLADSLSNVSDVPVPSWTAAKQMSYLEKIGAILDKVRGTNVLLESLLESRLDERRSDIALLECA